MIISYGSHSIEDFEEEGVGVIRSLIQDMKKIHTREQLLASTSRLQHHFDHLVSIMIAAQEFILSHPEIDKKEASISHEVSDQLCFEMNRLYRIEGGREIIEKCQEKALLRLDNFEKKRLRDASRTHNA